MKCLIIITALSLISCGGGGGGSSSLPFAGVWEGTVFLSSSECDAESDPSVEATHTINETDTMVVVDTSSGAVWEAANLSETTFTAVRTTSHECFRSNGTNPDNSYATLTETLTYDKQAADEARISYSYQLGNCSGNPPWFDNSCNRFYEGTMISVRK